MSGNYGNTKTWQEELQEELTELLLIYLEAPLGIVRTFHHGEKSYTEAGNPAIDGITNATAYELFDAGVDLAFEVLRCHEHGLELDILKLYGTNEAKMILGYVAARVLDDTYACCIKHKLIFYMGLVTARYFAAQDENLSPADFYNDVVAIVDRRGDDEAIFPMAILATTGQDSLIEEGLPMVYKEVLPLVLRSVEVPDALE